MWLLLSSVFLASLLGSLHCVGMCGPFALLASRTDSNAAPIAPTVAYSFGRLVTYAIAGALFGAIGMAINRSGALAHWQQTATYVAGALMIAVGAIALARYFGAVIRLPHFADPLNRLLQSGFQKTLVMPPVLRATAIGMLTTLMPCGWLYTFAIAAAGTGSPFWGAALMVAFWAGTVPIMAALMLGVQKIGQALQKRLPLAMALLVILIGLFTIAFRAPISLEGMAHASQAGNTEPDEQPVKTTASPGSPRGDNSSIGIEALRQQVETIDQSKLPCCQGNH